MNRIRIIFWSALLLFVLSPKSPIWADASGNTSDGASGNTPGGNPQSIVLHNPLSGGDGMTLYDFISEVINNVVLPIGGVVVVFMLIYAGFRFVAARGNPTELAKARQNFLHVVIGAAILLGAWTISEAIQATIHQLQS